MSVKEKELMQKFFIAPKEMAAGKPQVVKVLFMVYASACCECCFYLYDAE